LMIDDWWLMIDDWWLMIDDWWLMIDDWWLMSDGWFSMAQILKFSIESLGWKITGYVLRMMRAVTFAERLSSSFFKTSPSSEVVSPPSFSVSAALQMSMMTI
jgi:hypothetical protein